jgi:hypothetical protein
MLKDWSPAWHYWQVVEACLWKGLWARHGGNMSVISVLGSRRFMSSGPAWVLEWEEIVGPRSLPLSLFHFWAMRWAVVHSHTLLPWYIAISPKQWSQVIIMETSKTVSQDRPSLFINWLSQVVVIVMENWLTQYQRDMPTRTGACAGPICFLMEYMKYLQSLTKGWGDKWLPFVSKKYSVWCPKVNSGAFFLCFLFLYFTG